MRMRRFSWNGLHDFYIIFHRHLMNIGMLCSTVTSDLLMEFLPTVSFTFRCIRRSGVYLLTYLLTYPATYITWCDNKGCILTLTAEWWYWPVAVSGTDRVRVVIGRVEWVQRVALITCYMDNTRVVGVGRVYSSIAGVQSRTHDRTCQVKEYQI